MKTALPCMAKEVAHAYVIPGLSRSNFISLRSLPFSVLENAQRAQKLHHLLGREGEERGNTKNMVGMLRVWASGLCMGAASRPAEQQGRWCLKQKRKLSEGGP